MKRLQQLVLFSTLVCISFLMLATDGLAIGRIKGKHNHKSNAHSSSSVSGDLSVPASEMKSLKAQVAARDEGDSVASLGDDTTNRLSENQFEFQSEASKLYNSVQQLEFCLRDLKTVIQPIDPSPNATSLESSDSQSVSSDEDFQRSFAERSGLQLIEVQTAFSTSIIAPTLLEGLAGHEVFHESGPNLKLVNSSKADDYIRLLASVVASRMSGVASGGDDDEIEKILQYSNAVEECVRFQILLNKALYLMRESSSSKALEQLNAIRFVDDREYFICTAQRLLASRMKSICELTMKLDEQADTIDTTKFQRLIMSHNMLSPSWTTTQTRIANEFARKGEFRQAATWTPSVVESKQIKLYRAEAKEIILQRLNDKANAPALTAHRIFKEDMTEVGLGIELLNRLVIKNVTISHEFFLAYAKHAANAKSGSVLTR